MCLDPIAPVNGMVTFTGNSAITGDTGDTANYTCNDGFELIGPVSGVCTQTMAGAEFYPAAPTCRRK